MDRDMFHQVEGLHDKNKMNTGYNGFTSTKPHANHRQHWSKSQTSWNVTDRRGYTSKPASEIKREFRVVRDNRTSQNVIADITKSFQKSHIDDRQHKDNHRGSSIAKEHSSSSGSVVDHYNTSTKNSNGQDLCQNLNGRSDSAPGLDKNEKPTVSDLKSLTKERTVTELSTSKELSKEVKNNTQAHAPNSLDPVHVPSSRPAGTVGTIRRKVGVVGVRRQVIDASNSFSAPLSEQDDSSVSKPITSNMPANRSFVNNHHLAKPHQQVTGLQKGTSGNMEWKPKSSRKPNADDCANMTKQVQPTGSSKKLSEVNLSNNKHVIIPEHLKVTKSEQANLIFGTFGISGSDALTSTENPGNNPSSASNSSSISVAIKESDTDQSNRVESQVKASQIHDCTYAAVKPQLSVQMNDDNALSTRDIESYPDAELNQKHIPSYTSFEPQRQNQSSFSEFPAYEPQMTIGMPFTKMTLQDNVQLPGSQSGQEITGMHVTNINPASVMSMEQQQQPIQQLSPNYANLFPYRQIYPSMYIPQMLMPNYSNISVQNNHPSNRSNYLMMPNGSPQLATESMKYKPSVQSVPPTIGYGNYSNLGMYAYGNTAGMIDASGINQNKDNNLYVPNPQVQSENGMWIQTPREVPSNLRPSPCYNMATQAQGLQTFMPANQALNQAAYPSSQLQYTGFYHPQPGSVVGPSNPSLSSAFGMVPASPTQVVGHYQQHQLGHLGWTNANF